ncbi:MAG: aldo/keto reductase [Deferrisomatales bacterium]
MALPTRTLGKTGVQVSALGLGGEGILRTYGRFREAAQVIRKALEVGVTYFESARAYADSEEYLGRSLGPDRKRVFLATKTHNRRARGARAHLDESLTLLRTDWVDLWMLHDLRTQADLDTIAGPGGALEVVDRAKQAGEVRFAGVSGHQDPDILRRALDLYPFDCVLLPVNPAEPFAGAFADAVLPAARERDLGVIAMKTLCRGLAARVPGFPGVAALLGYALSTPGVTVASVGCDDPAQVEENARAVAAYAPPSPDERDALEQWVASHAKQLLYYRPQE